MTHNVVSSVVCNLLTIQKLDTHPTKVLTMTNLVCSERRKHTRYPGSEMIGCSCVLASLPGPAQLLVACSTVHARGELGSETSCFLLILDWVNSSLHFMLNYERKCILHAISLSYMPNCQASRQLIFNTALNLPIMVIVIGSCPFIVTTIPIASNSVKATRIQQPSFYKDQENPSPMVMRSLTPW